MTNETPPRARPGLLGVWDHLAGPGVDPLESGLIVGAMVAGPGLAVAWARAAGADWDLWRWLILAILACDLVGGVAANALAPAKRWHHRPGRSPRAHFTYCALHIHPIVLALATADALSQRAALIIYGLLLAGSGLTLMAPARLKGAVALLCAAAGIALSAIWVPVASPEGWLPAMLYLKVIAGYLVPAPDSPVPPVPTVPPGPWS
jgi:hypothetical protein